jgi:hypothetical protein
MNRRGAENAENAEKYKNETGKVSRRHDPVGGCGTVE